MDKEEKGISNFLLGDMPAYDSAREFSPYTLEDFRSFYRKICSQLKASESELLFKLSKSSENDYVSHSNLLGSLERGWHPDLPRPFEEKAVKEAKKRYLHGLLCGASIDYMEVFSDEFRFAPFNAKLIGKDNVMLFVSRHRKDGSERTSDEMMRAYSCIAPGNAHSGGFVSHSVDKNDYVLMGKRLPEEEYQKRQHEWELDVNWDGD